MQYQAIFVMIVCVGNGSAALWSGGETGHVAGAIVLVGAAIAAGLGAIAEAIGKSGRGTRHDA